MQLKLEELLDKLAGLTDDAWIMADAGNMAEVRTLCEEAQEILQEIMETVNGV